MAQIHTVTLTDDLDGGPADTTVRFAIDGTALEIDLSETNAAQLRDDLALFIAHARKVTAPPAAKRDRVPTAAATARRNAVELSAIRTWANDSGMELAARGRIPAEVRAAFRAAWESANPGLSYTDHFA